MLQDYHMHTVFSVDGEAQPDALADDRVRLGINCFAITDHADFCAGLTKKRQRELTDGLIDTFTQLRGAIEKIRMRHPQVSAAFGIEIGQPLYSPDQADRLISALDFDVVLVSQHEAEGGSDFYFADFTQRSWLKRMDDYFDFLPRLVKWGNFDVMAHITYPFRQMYRQHLEAPVARYHDAITALMRQLIDSGKALELNVSPCFEGYPPMPTLELLKEYRQMGGQLLTIGSDDHKCEFAPQLPLLGAELARQAGFRYFTAYRQRKPIQIALD